MRKPSQKQRIEIAEKIRNSNPRNKTFDEYFEQAKEIISKIF